MTAFANSTYAGKVEHGQNKHAFAISHAAVGAGCAFIRVYTYYYSDGEAFSPRENAFLAVRRVRRRRTTRSPKTISGPSGARAVPMLRIRAGGRACTNKEQTIPFQSRIVRPAQTPHLPMSVTTRHSCRRTEASCDRLYAVVMFDTGAMWDANFVRRENIATVHISRAEKPIKRLFSILLCPPFSLVSNSHSCNRYQTSNYFLRLNSEVVKHRIF